MPIAPPPLPIPSHTLCAIWFSRLFLVIVLCVFSAGWALADETSLAPQKEYVVVVNNAPPFRIIEKWGDKSGYVGAYIDTINEISQRSGLSLTFTHVPFPRALKMMEDGTADLMLGPLWSVDRAEYMIYLNFPFPSEAKIFYLSHQLNDISKYSDLKGIQIGVLRSARYFEPFDSDPSLNKIEIENYENGFRLLEHDRIQALILPERQGKYLIRNYGYDFKASSFRVPSLPSFITISRKSDLVQHKAKIEKTMEELSTEGYFERLMQAYLE